VGCIEVRPIRPIRETVAAEEAAVRTHGPAALQERDAT